MLTQQICQYIFIGAAIACGVMAAVSILLFFLLRIPKVINDLSGRTARKAIDDIRRQNEESGDKSYQSSAVNLERGKLTDKISKSGRLIPKRSDAFGTGVITEKISTGRLDGAGETTLLDTAGETTLLDAGNETTLLSSAGETAILSAQVADQVYTDQTFTLEVEITYIHTAEVIA